MSQLERRAEQKRDDRAAKGKKNGTATQGRLHSFVPNEPQKMAIKALYSDEVQVLNALGVAMVRGTKLSIGYMEVQDSWWVIIRENRPDWQNSQAISVVHRDLPRALACMAYAVTEAFPGFPLEAIPGPVTDVDW